jgi:hypothetical protein
MLAMQSFHTWLFKAAPQLEPSAEALGQVTQLNPTEMIALKSDLDWTPWGEPTAKPSKV